MSRKIIIALAAVSLSIAALAPTTASAARFGGGGHGGGHFGGHVGGRGHFGGHFGGRFGGHFNNRVGRWNHPGWNRWGWNHGRWNYGWRRPYYPGYVAPVVGASAAPNYAAAPTTGNCSCLTKQYTPEGNVLFQDLCTKESALAPGQNAQNNQNTQQ